MDNQSASEGLTKILYGLPYVGVSSSQYVKDSDPKLLDKQPFWKRAYARLSEKISSLAPQPELQTTSIKA